MNPERQEILHTQNERLAHLELDPEFDRKIDELYSMLPDYLLNDNKPLYIPLEPIDSTITARSLLEQIIPRFFVQGPVHKNMTDSTEYPYCDNIHIKRTLDEEISHEASSMYFDSKINSNPAMRGKSNSCQIRLNNVLPIQINSNNYIVKRLTRFTLVDKYDYNFIASGCDRRIDDSGETFAKERNDDCEYRELFTCLIFSHYLRKLYGNICPKIYGVLLVPKSDPYITREIYIIQEPMDETSEQWIFKEKTLSQLKKYIEDMIFLNICLHSKPIPQKLLKRFPDIIYPKTISNKTQWERIIKSSGQEPELFLYFYDCKMDNVMIDIDGNWRIIDIDGLLITTGIEPTMLNTDYNPLMCVFSKGFKYFGGKFDFYNALRLVKIINDKKEEIIQQFGTDHQVSIRKNLEAIKKYMNYIINLDKKYTEEDDSPIEIFEEYQKINEEEYGATGGGKNISNKYKQKYLKYKQKYLQLKNSVN
jgi:hypothetical protein